MKEITANSIREGVKSAFLAANTDVRPVGEKLKERKAQERSPIGREVLEQLISNADIAFRRKMPTCQDTGMAVVYLDMGQDVHVSGGDITEAINEGVREAYEEGYFRKSVVDPLSRKNTGDNTPAIIHTRIVPGEEITITVLPKGFGSENMSEIRMLTPASGKEGLMDAIVEIVQEKGENACPPLIVGVGIGGTFERCAELSKRSLMRELGEMSPDPKLREMEQELLTRINKLGIGPMGLGGDTTALAVNIEKFPTHIAGLPVAVNMMCHALRHERVVLS